MKRANKVITTSKLVAIKKDRMLNFTEMAKRMGEHPARVRAYTYARGRGTVDFAAHKDLEEKARRVLREHAIWLLTLTGDVLPPKIAEKEPVLEGLRQ